jgi:hypothetical protein
LVFDEDIDIRKIEVELSEPDIAKIKGVSKDQIRGRWTMVVD